MKRIGFVILSAAVLCGSLNSRADLPTKKVLTLEVAKKLAAAAEAEAKKRGSTVVFVGVEVGALFLLL